MGVCRAAERRIERHGFRNSGTGPRSEKTHRRRSHGGASGQGRDRVGPGPFRVRSRRRDRRRERRPGAVQRSSLRKSPDAAGSKVSAFHPALRGHLAGERFGSARDGLFAHGADRRRDRPGLRRGRSVLSDDAGIRRQHPCPHCDPRKEAADGHRPSEDVRSRRAAPRRRGQDDCRNGGRRGGRRLRSS